MMLNEHHYADPQVLRNAFQVIKKSISFTPAGRSRNSTVGTHGGELIAFSNYLSVVAIEPAILNTLTDDIE